MSRIVLVSPDPIGPLMAGPGLRFWHMAAELATAGHQVTLLAEVTSGPPPPGVELTRAGKPTTRQTVEAADVVVVHGYALSLFPELTGAARLVVDLYNPFHIEALRGTVGEAPSERRRRAERALGAIREQIAAGDFFVVASERQRLFWLGHLALAGRLSADLHDADPTFRRLVDVAGYGIERTPPVRGEPELRRRHGIAPDDVVALWAGGVYDWLDPLIVVRAFAAVERDVPDAHLVFLGLQHPSPSAKPPAVVGALRGLVHDLGLERVHLHDEWVPVSNRGSVLLEADVAVSAHPITLESELAYRTRLLDHLWAGLPTVATAGDELAGAIAAAGAGVAVAPGHDEAMFDALRRYLTDPSARQRAGRAAAALATELTWDRQLAPLLRYCEQPFRTPASEVRRQGAAGADARYLAGRLWDYLRAGRFGMAARRVRAELGRRGQRLR